ncbi:DUF4267 domain-containing protein [Streptomyces sp. NPDC056948]|uniref:DUF4267 domain-containing protein n=1 Tax=Streptomyces sp. NPDC056948 TaxID=3345975 RepID=UPI0036339EC0
MCSPALERSPSPGSPPAVERDAEHLHEIHDNKFVKRDSLNGQDSLMLTTSATVLAGLLGAALILMGGRAFTTPQAAVGFGIPDTPADHPAFRAWLRVKGLREIACGVFVFVLMLVATTSLLGWYVMALAAIPAGDAVVVLRSGGPKAAAYGIHGATAVVMLAASIGLLV